MLEELKMEVYQANLDLVIHNLVIFTWGNVSAFDDDSKLVVIKPSGIEYDSMKAGDMVVCDLEGNVIEGSLKPSSDLMTHLELYKKFEGVKSIVHTHSPKATSFAQAKLAIPVYGTTHGDYFNGPIPCTRILTLEEINGNYEKETGAVIIETFKDKKLNPCDVPACLVASHGPFAWGTSPKDAVHNAVVLEELAKMAIDTRVINSTATEMQEALLQKHFFRKHGENSYYGQ